METPKEMRFQFLTNADEKLKKFGEKIIVPSKEHPVVGIRTPLIKAFVKEICGGDWRSYLDTVEDEYHEDVGIRGLIIAYAKMNDDERFGMIADHVTKMDNWALCDSFCSALKVNKKNADAFWDFILPYLNSEEEFHLRFPIAMMIFHFIDEKHVDSILKYADAVKNEAYYVKMAVAWCIADCFIKFPDVTMQYLKNNTLDKWTFNKALSKITDSFRVDASMKEDIRKMRRK